MAITGDGVRSSAAMRKGAASLLLSLMWFIGGAILMLRYRIVAVGKENVPSEGTVLLLGNHVSWLDWMFVQLPLKRRLRFVMDKNIYEWKSLHWMFRLGRTIPVSPRASKGAFEAAINALDLGEAVAIFPEGAITRSGEIGKFHRGFEIIAVKSRAVRIVPFYIDGMQGSLWSYTRRTRRCTGLRRRVTIVYGEPMPANSSADSVRSAVLNLKDTLAQ